MIGWQSLLLESKRLIAARRGSEANFPTGAALFTALRKSAGDVYGRVRTTSPYVPFVAATVQELPSHAPMIPMLDYLPPRQAEVFANEERCIKGLDAGGKAAFADLNKRYDMVGGNSQEWIKYLLSDEADPLWTYVLDGEERGHCAVLAVPRTKDAKLRKILAICPFNYATLGIPELFGEEEADMGMHGGALLAQVHSTHSHMHWAGADETQAFTAVEAAPWMWKWCAGPAVAAREIPQCKWPPNATESSKLRPLYKRLRMGGTLSVYILMMMHFGAVARVIKRNPAFRFVQVLNLREVRFGDAVRIDNGVVYIHVDDVVVGSHDRSFVMRVMNAIVDELRSMVFW